MKFLLASCLAGAATAFTPSSFNGAQVTQRVASKASMSMETAEDLAVLAKKCNPVLGFFDPLGLSEQSFWDTTPEATIGFLRESEVKVKFASQNATSNLQKKNFAPGSLTLSFISLMFSCGAATILK